MLKLDLEKAEKPEIKLPTSLDHRKSKRAPEKHLLLLCYYAKTCVCLDHNKLWKFFKRQEYQTILPVSWEICMQVKKQQLETDMEQ